VRKPFLHQWEGRVFSHNPLGKFSVHCPCDVCQVCAESSTTMQDFLFLRAYCVVFGYGRCNLSELTEELKLKEKVLREISVNPISDVLQPGDRRAMMALLEEEPIRARGPNQIAKGIFGDKSNLVLSSIVHKKELPFQKLQGQNRIVVPWLEGKKVVFMGVSPTVVGETQLHQGSTAKRTSDMIVFGLDWCSILQGVSPKVMYIPEIHDITGYQRTGRRVDMYHEYERLDNLENWVDSEYSENMGMEVSGDLTWTLLVPGLYRVKRADFEKIDKGGIMISPSKGPSIEKYPYHYIETLEKICPTKGISDFTHDHTLNAQLWTELKILSHGAMLDLLDGKLVPELICFSFESGITHVHNRRVNTCFYAIEGRRFVSSTCHNHVHGLRFIEGKKCYVYMQPHLKARRMDSDPLFVTFHPFEWGDKNAWEVMIRALEVMWDPGKINLLPVRMSELSSGSEIRYILGK